MQTRKKSARRGLLVSATSLLLSVAMLVGTTFAWFTDSVSSGTNTIKAGNLDIELTHSNAYVTTDESVTETVKLFVNSDGLTADWEPGVVAYENFTIKNAGSLALSFRFSLKSLVAGVGYNFVAEPTENGEYTATDRSLLDVIKVAVINNGTFSGDREVAKGLTYLGTLKEFVTNNEAVISGSNMMPGATQYFAVVLYWPSDTEPASALNGGTLNDNSYNIQNGKKTSKSSTVYEVDNENPALYVNLGIDLKATQYTYENDSFGNDYDESQVQATVVASSAVVEATADQPTVFTNPVAPEGNSSDNQTKVTFSPNALPVGTYTQTTQTTDLIGTTGFEVTASETLVPAAVGDTTPTENLSQQVVANIDLSIVDSNGTKVFTTGNSGTATVETYIAKNLTGVCVAYRGEGEQPVISNVTYDPQTGKLSFTTNHFSEYYATGDGVAYVREKGKVFGTLDEAVTGADDGNTVVLLKDTSFHNTVHVLDVKSGCTLDLNGKTITVPYMSAIFQGENITIRNGDFASDASYALWVGDEGTTDNVLIENVTVNGGINVYNASNVVLRNVNADATGHDYYAVWADENAHITIESGRYIGENGKAAVLAYEEEEITVKDGTFSSDPNKYVAEGKCAIQNSEGMYVIADATHVTTEDQLKAALSNSGVGDYVYVADDIGLTTPLTISRNVTLVGNGSNTISAYPVYVASTAKVTFKNVNFATPDNDSDNASSVYASGLKGKVVFDGCTFTNPQWECIQITPMDGAEIVVTDCTFIADGNGTYAQANGTKIERLLHIQNTAATGDYTAVITNNKFIGVDLCRNAVIDVDDIAAFANVTCGGNTFANHDRTAVNTLADGMIYVNINGKYDAANVATNTYAQFTQTPAAALHH